MNSLNIALNNHTATMFFESQSGKVSYPEIVKNIFSKVAAISNKRTLPRKRLTLVTTTSSAAPMAHAGTLFDNFITVDILSDKLGVSRGTIYNMMKRGLPSRQIGRIRRFLWAEVKVWLEKWRT